MGWRGLCAALAEQAAHAATGMLAVLVSEFFCKNASCPC